MLFQNVIGQQEIKNYAIRSIKEDRISHTQLFVGDEGYGPLPMALAYARALLCSNLQDNDACGTCPSCLKINNYAHPDLHFSFPVVLKQKKNTSTAYMLEFREALLKDPYLSLNDWLIHIDGENKSGIIGKDESYEVLKKLTLKSFEGGRKIMIIWMAEKMNGSAANKLLKLLEEPPEDTIFLLIASSIDAILPTIISRTQITKFNGLKSEQLTSALQANYQISAEKASEIAMLSEGNYGIARDAALNTDSDSGHFDELVKWMRLCFSKDVVGAIDWVSDFTSKGREEQKQFIAYSLQIFRQSYVGGLVGADNVRLPEKEKAFALKFAPFVNQNTAEGFLNEFSTSYYALERNANPKIVLLDLSFKLFKLVKK